MIRLFGKYFLSKVLFAAWFFLTISPLALLAWLLRNHQQEIPSWLGTVAALWSLASLFGSIWLASTTSRYMVDENLMFLDAVKRTWYDLRLQLEFIPVIGCLFTPDEDKTRPDDD